MKQLTIFINVQCCWARSDRGAGQDLGLQILAPHDATCRWLSRLCARCLATRPGSFPDLLAFAWGSTNTNNRSTTCGFMRILHWSSGVWEMQRTTLTSNAAFSSSNSLKKPAVYSVQNNFMTLVTWKYYVPTSDDANGLAKRLGVNSRKSFCSDMTSGLQL